jgi:Rad3-related DNA helicase
MIRTSTGASRIPSMNPEFDARLPLPPWVVTLRQLQVDAVQVLVDRFDQGYEQMFCDAPTGSGKTLLGEVLRRSLGVRALYVSSNIQLQEQVLKDFPYARVIKGRRHYATELKPEITCDACEGRDCGWCTEPATCPYVIAKQTALGAQLAVANMHYFLNEANHRGGEFGLRKGETAFDLIIVDEADRLEATLMSVISLEYTTQQMNVWKVAPPLTVDHEVVVPWLTNKVLPAIRYRLDAIKMRIECVDGRVRASLRKQADVLAELVEKTETVIEEYPDRNWVMVETALGVAFRPVSVARYGRSWLWRHSPRWLVMSASLVKPKVMARELGLPLVDEAQVITVPSTFAAHRRPIYALDVARLSRTEIAEGLPKVLDQLEQIILSYPTERVLVHCHSRKILSACRERFGDLSRARWYTTPKDREALVEDYLKTPGAVMFSVAMDRGLDLPDEACRVVVIVKVPFADLSDAQVAARKALNGGDAWYDTMTIRSLVQMSGRGMRHEHDWAVTYIMDASFRKFFQRHRLAFPSWWVEAVITPERGTFPIFKMDESVIPHLVQPVHAGEPRVVADWLRRMGAMRRRTNTRAIAQYTKAALSVEATPDLRAIAEAGRITDLPGIGDVLGQKILAFMQITPVRVPRTKTTRTLARAEIRRCTCGNSFETKKPNRVLCKECQDGEWDRVHKWYRGE